MEIIKALQWRYATKKFDPDRIVPEEKIEKLKAAFNLTATSYGLQPLRLVVVRDKELQETLKGYAFNQNQLSTASHVLVLCIEQEVGEEYIDKYFQSVSEIRNTPEEILRPHRNSLVDDFEKKPIEEIRTWATHQAYLVLGTLLTSCAVEGIDSCPMEGFLPEKFDEVLELEKHNLRSVLVLPIGYRASEDIFAGFKKVRRPLDEMILEVGKGN